MPSNEGHIHWPGVTDTVTYLNQELLMSSERSNVITEPKADPIGTVRIKAVAFVGSGVALPTNGWEAVPGTSPILEVRQDGSYPVDLIRIRAAV